MTNKKNLLKQGKVSPESRRKTSKQYVPVRRNCNRRVIRGFSMDNTKELW